MSFSRQKEVLEMPNLIEVQKDSYQWFLNEGLKEVFNDISPIADYNGRLSLEFVDFALCEGELVEEVYAYCNLHGLWKCLITTSIVRVDNIPAYV
jgi:DNA-directed RNA polymerase beta subunit